MNGFRTEFRLLCLGIGVFLHFVSSASAQQTVTTDWQVMVLDRQRIGYASLETRRSGDVLRLKQSSHMEFQRFGEKIELQSELQTEELLDGTLRSFRFELRNPPNKPTISSGTVRGNSLDLELNVNGRRSEKTVTLPPDLKSPLWQERMFRGRTLREGVAESFDTWLPELSKTSRMRFRVDQERETKMFDGDNQRLFKVHIQNSALPTLRTRAYLDAQGNWLKTESDFFGKTLYTYQVPETEALQELAGDELDLAMNTIVKAGGIRDPHRFLEVTYRITLEKDDPSRYFSSGPTQTIQKVDDRTILLMVRKLALPPRTTISRKPDDKYLKPTEFLQADDYRVAQLARRAAAGITDPNRVAVNMEKSVHELVKDKNFSTALASAAEVAEQQEGDCTEHAMLLAAMLRAENLPSRIAVGFVYSDRLNGFAGHMWTEVWLRDRWYPLDATLAQGGIGPGHLKLSDSALDENSPAPVTSFLPMMQLLGQMTIEVERKR
ncbi:MAG: transglutaminase domain-containing protein [Planctomycetaceae bacterium]|nr:transglutaminase domain-containing protein [Planctomycetaceae bacterium]